MNRTTSFLLKASWPAILSLGALCLLAFGMARIPLDAFDDGLYADVAKNILKTGDWLNFYWLGGIPFLEKPPLQFWITALNFKVFGISEFSARLFPVFCGIGGLLAIMIFARRCLSWQASCIAGLALLSFPAYLEYSTKAMLDIPVTFLIALSVIFFYRAWEGRHNLYLFYGLALSGAVLTKSVVGLVPVIASALFLLLKRPDKDVFKRYMKANCVAALVILPWHLYAWIHHGNLFLREYFLYHVLQRMAGDIGYHAGRPLWYYFTEIGHANPLSWVLIISIAVVAILAIFYKDSFCLLLLVWMVAIIIPISVSSVKLSWYTVPLYPPFALSIAVVSDWLMKKTQKKIIFILIMAGALSAALWTGYHFHSRQEQRLSEDNIAVQLKNLLTQFRAFSAPQDLLHVYEIGEAAPLTGFYADRKMQYMFGSKETLAVHQKIPSNYLGKGTVRLVPDVHALKALMDHEGGFYLLQKNIHAAVQSDTSRCRTLDESRDLIIVQCAPGKK
jgi:4-amino-4-deoxy-L-arabinose transferase-like glycosyltransferase